jgi:hypothetical protein
MFEKTRKFFGIFYDNSLQKAKKEGSVPHSNKIADNYLKKLVN